MLLPRPVFDIDIFKPARLTTDAAIKSALAELEANASDLDINTLVDYLLLQPLLLAFTLSATGKGSLLTSKIMKDFPVVPQSFIGSPSSRVLSELSLYMLFLPSPLPAETTRRFKDYRRMVEFAPRVLKQLISTITFVETSADGSRNSKMVHKHVDRNWAKGIDLQAFQHLSLRIPDTQEDAEKLALEVLSNQKTILEFYISTLYRADLRETIKRAYIVPAARARDRASDIAEESEEPTGDSALTSSSVRNESSCDTPSAYSTIQPARAALYFDSAKGMGAWRILISTRMIKNLRETRRRDAQTLKIMLRKIKELSKGLFSGDNFKQVNSPKSQVPVYEARLTRDLRLVYQIDCIPDSDSDRETQVIKIFGTYTHAQLDGRFCDSMSQQLARRGTDYVQRCKIRKRSCQSGDSAILPATFPQLDVVLTDASPITMELPRQDLDEIHSLLVLEKFVSISQALLYSVFADQDVQHVFQMSRQEQDIVEHEYSCYVLGRSGTGKTTTMLFKMLGIQRAWQMEAIHLPKPRQLFVTKSSVLAAKVEEYFDKLMDSLAMATLSPEELQKLTKSTTQDRDSVPLVNRGDQMNWQNKLPARFSLLRDEHFPLFTTFDRLCKLIQGDIAADEIQAERHGFWDIELESSKYQAATMPWMSRKSRQQPSGIFVSYPVFQQTYWPHLSSLTRGMDSFVVFNEFIGVIKGSEEALRQKTGFLDRKTYENYSYRSQSTCASVREVVYSIFELYIRKKQERGDYDAADRIYAILTRVQDVGVPGKVDYLYVDEAQDNLLSDALLLRKLCKNPNGMFWAGDTAQTISAGSSFSFNELKAFLFRIEQQSPGTGLKREAPRMFQLLVNYRSHAGIVNCAHSVIELITQFWPNAIDALSPEKGLVDGVKPVFFSGGLWHDQPGDKALENFLFGTTKSHIEFGAQQCILVRHQAAANELRERGIKGSIMTLYDSKGLEFNDVLLYNFFQDSAADISQWKVVLRALNLQTSRHLTVPGYAGMCSELKFLYVAITRARKNLWIVDFSETSGPMQDFWSAKGLVQTCTPGMAIPHLAVASSRDEWAMQGNLHFEKEQYARAIECFEKASMSDKAAVARAYLLRENARMGISSSSRSKAFSESARAFLKCASSISTGKRAYLRTAADCYEQAGDDRQAAKAYLDAEEYNRAAQRQCDCEEYDNAVHIVQEHKDKMDADVIQGVVHSARLFYFRKNKQAKALGLFESPDAALDFTIEYHLDDARLDLLIYLSRFAEAAELYVLQGQILEAIKFFLKPPRSEHSRLRAMQCILQSLWQNITFRLASKHLQSSTKVRELFEAAAQLDSTVWSSNDLDELSMFRLIISSASETVPLRQLSDRFRQCHHNPIAAVLCLDHVFDTLNQIHIMIQCDVKTTLQTFVFYARILTDMALDTFPCRNVSVQKLFAFHESRKNVFLVPRQTYLHNLLKSQRTEIIESNDAGKLVLGKEISRIIKDCLQGVLRRRVSQLTEELVASMKEVEPWSLSASLMFVRYIVQERLLISATILCDFIDCLCASLVLSTRSREKMTLHNVALPRNWLMNLSTSFGKGGERDTSLLPVLIAPVGELLERVCSTDADHIIFDSGSEDIFVSRMCRALCLLGYNIPSPGLKSEILRVVSTFAQDDDLTNFVISLPYIEARNWSDIICAIDMPVNTGSSREQVIQLCHHSRRRSQRVDFKKRLFFENVQDVPLLLHGKPVARPVVQQLAHKGLVQSNARTVATDSGSYPIADQNAIHETSTERVGAIPDVVAGESETKVESEPLEDIEVIDFGSSDYEAWGMTLSTPPSREEIHAATVIQNTYRSAISRRQKLCTDLVGFPAARDRLHAACLAETQKIHWVNGGYYKKVFLGPLPHILYCLEEVKNYASSAKEQVKRRLKTAEGQELEDLGKRQTEFTSLLKLASKLHKSLQPKAEVHRKQDMVTLARYVLEADILIQGLPVQQRIHLQADLAIAVTGIARGRLCP